MHKMRSNAFLEARRPSQLICWLAEASAFSVGVAGPGSPGADGSYHRKALLPEVTAWDGGDSETIIYL